MGTIVQSLFDRSTRIVALSGVLASSTLLAALPPQTTFSRDYLLIGMGPVNESNGRPGVGQAVNVNNFELGANKAPVPSTSGFLTGGSSGGPGLLGNVPNIPLIARPVSSGVCYDGNIAITHFDGVFNLQDVGVYADLGIRVARSRSAADVGTSNSFYNDPFFFPNTFTSSGFTNPGVNNNTGGNGVDVNPNEADQNTRIDKPRQTGVVGNYNFAPLLAELVSARGAINALLRTGTLDLRSSGGQIQSQTRVINLAPGLNVIDVLTNGNDFLLDNSNLILNGPADAVAIVRIPDNAKFNISNGNVLVGNGGIGLNSVLFYTDRPDNAGHYNFNNAVLNGVAFWSLGASGGEIVINNSQGCTQLVADKINLNDVRFCRCAFAPPAPTLSISIVGGGSCASGGSAEFTIVVTNDGNVDLTDVSVISSADSGCSIDIGELDAGQSYTYTCVVPNVAADVTNEVCATGDFGSATATACDEATVEIAPASVRLRIQNDGGDVRTVMPGDDVDFEFVVTNTGETTLENIEINSSIPLCSRTFATLAPGESITFVCTFLDVQEKFTLDACATAESCGVSVTECDKSSIFVGGCRSDCPADVNGDEQVDLVDLSTLLANFGQTNGALPENGDLNCDGDVDLSDLAALLPSFGRACVQ
ncbi:MAG: hypothetical protein ACKVS9_12285 [Phycisphaerae bacterium]